VPDLLRRDRAWRGEVVLGSRAGAAPRRSHQQHRQRVDGQDRDRQPQPDRIALADAAPATRGPALRMATFCGGA
jgi:hypothetical protein